MPGEKLVRRPQLGKHQSGWELWRWYA